MNKDKSNNSDKWMLDADKILKFLYGNDDYIAFGSLQIAEKLSLSEEDVLIACFMMIEERPRYISEKKFKESVGDHKATIMKVSESISTVRAFLAAGGFTAIYQTNQLQLQEIQQQQSREALLSELQISELLRLPEEALKTRRLALAAIIVAIATLLFEIGKFFLT